MDEDFQTECRRENVEESQMDDRSYCDPPEPGDLPDATTFDDVVAALATLGAVALEAVQAMMTFVLDMGDDLLEAEAHGVIEDLSDRSEDGSW